tara:strand:+ start:100 stop:360 length:261 start_codon:yes stop_codon:yes gene_type:complete
MADTIGLQDISVEDTGKGKILKTGNLKRSYNMPSPKKCATEWKKLGYSSMSDCVSYGDKKETMMDMDKPKSKKMKSKSPMKSRMSY